MLYEPLIKAESAIRSFDVRQIPNIDITNPAVIREYERYLRVGYQDTVAMLAAAQESGQGLFMSITLYA